MIFTTTALTNTLRAITAFSTTFVTQPMTTTTVMSTTALATTQASTIAILKTLSTTAEVPTTMATTTKMVTKSQMTTLNATDPKPPPVRKITPLPADKTPPSSKTKEVMDNDHEEGEAVTKTTVDLNYIKMMCLLIKNTKCPRGS